MLILTSMYGKLKIVRISLTPKFLPQPYIGSGTMKGEACSGKPQRGHPPASLPSPERGSTSGPPQGVPFEEAVYLR